jgi:uncharacterized membrane protein YphA (DoxX/SURF4 family)
MNNLTRIPLIVLRLSIGWLFVAEGLEKVQPHPTANLREWSSAGYLRQATGPLAPYFQWQAGGDADILALERLTVTGYGVSPALRTDWEQYLARFADHYKLSDAQRAEAKQKLDDSLNDAAKWLADTTTRKELDKNTDFPTAAFAPRKSPAERIADYRAQVEEYRQAENVANPAFGEDVFKAKLRAMKAGAAKTRTGLLADLEAPMHKALESVLNDGQKIMSAVPPPAPPAVIVWTDRLVKYGLLVVGVGLLLGLFTRLSCLGGAVFLIALFVVLPPFPWSPENLRAEGPNVFINKNLIMAVALLALATTRSGLWFGLDGLLQFLNPWSYRAERRARAETAAV